MVALSPLVLTLRNILDQIGLSLLAQRTRLTRGIHFDHWQSMFAAVGYWWWADANVSWRDEILLHDRPDRFLTFRRDCREETPHEGFDELGVGWYAQMCR